VLRQNFFSDILADAVRKLLRLVGLASVVVTSGLAVFSVAISGFIRRLLAVFRDVFFRRFGRCRRSRWLSRRWTFRPEIKNKRIIRMIPGTNVIKLFCPLFTNFRNKLYCLSLASFSNLFYKHSSLV